MLAQPNFGRLGAVGYRSLAAAVRALFANNEQGAWYDPQDYGTSGFNGVGTLYQDSAGTTPVTAVEQPVGLMLDKRKGLVLGSELVTFASLTGTAEWSYASNVWTLTNSTTNSQTLSFTGLTSGNWYRMTVTVTAINAGSLSFRHPNSSTVISNSPTISAAGTYTIYFVASSTTVWLRNSAVGQTITVSAFSVREIAGNHAYQSTSAARPTLRARYNQLTYSEQINNAAWSKGNASVTGTDFLVEDTATATHQLVQTSNITPAIGTELVAVIEAKAEGRTAFNFFVGGVTATTGVVFDLSAVTSTNPVGYTSSIIDLGDGFFRCEVRCTATAASTATSFIRMRNGAGATTYTGDGVSGIRFRKADLRPSNLATGLIPLYQRIAAATDYDTVGFPVYIQGNGSSQFMLTSAIDFSGTDKMTVWSAVRKLSDAAQGMVCELTASYAANAASMFLSAPGSAAANYTSGSRGNAVAAADQVSTATTYTAPISGVLSSSHDIAGDLTTLRVNSTAATSATGDKGAGNFANAALYLLARGGASLWFGGYFYGAIIRGAASDEGQIQAGEKYLNNRARVY